MRQRLCIIKKSLYGLKQASRQWFANWSSKFELNKQGYTQSKNNYSVFLKHNGTLLTIVVVYVDDIIITVDDSAIILHLKAHLDQVFSIKDLGILSFFLGIEVSYLSQGIVLTQAKFTKELLSSCDMDVSKPAVTPLPLHLKLSADEGTLLADPTLYRCMVGKLKFLTHIRPDLAYSVQNLTQFMHSPTPSHLTALTHVLRYVANTAGQGILIKGADHLTLQALILGALVLIQGSLFQATLSYFIFSY